MEIIKTVSEKSYKEKTEALCERLRVLTLEDTVVAFSGGADSSLLLKLAVLAARENGTKVFGITAGTKLHPLSDLESARKIAEEIGAEHLVVHMDELEKAGIMKNPEDRCYRCKKYLFEELQKKAKELKAPVLLEGTNADDCKVYRPGLRALQELGIISPLMEAGVTKEEVRQLSREYEITTADRPAAPCLATRFPYGTVLTWEKLRLVEQAETFLKTFGFYNVRLRVHDSCARIEVDEKEFALMCKNSRAIVDFISGLGFDYVTLDLGGFRSGSMDLHVANRKMVEKE